MKKNTLIDLNDHLFEQLEKLNDDSLTGKELSEECKRAQALTRIAASIINSMGLTLSALKYSEQRAENCLVDDQESKEPMRVLLGKQERKKLWQKSIY